jgi:hypothetical protein
MTLKHDLAPFLDGRLADWYGLPELRLDEMEAAFGQPAERSTVELGYYPAIQAVFPHPGPSGGIIAYERAGTVVMIQALAPPPVALLAALGEPTTIVPHEILVPDAYAPEYLYGPRGLALTVAIPFDSKDPREIVRCRSVRPFATARDFGPDYYKPFEDRTHYS